MGAGIRVLAALLAALAAATAGVTAQLRQDYYAAVCPDLESIVRAAVSKKVQAQPVAVGATIRLFFHDCFVEVRASSSSSSTTACVSDGPGRLAMLQLPACMQGCDASVILVSTGNNTAEKDHPSNLSLAGDGFDTVIQAKAAVDAVPACANQVSCADILALATRDVIELVPTRPLLAHAARSNQCRHRSHPPFSRTPQSSRTLEEIPLGCGAEAEPSSKSV
jgi:peroxidase